jgi:pimeloyl-ACP methyl ester carboxylesterase
MGRFYGGSTPRPSWRHAGWTVLGPHVDDALRAALPPERAGESPALADERRFLTAGDGTLVHVHRTSHMVMLDQPQAVLHAIDDVLAR